VRPLGLPPRHVQRGPTTNIRSALIPHAPGLLANNLTPASSALFEAGFSPAIQSRFHKQSNGRIFFSAARTKCPTSSCRHRIGEAKDPRMGVVMRRSIPRPFDGNQFPLTLAGGLRSSFADVASESLPDGLTALMRRLDANGREQGHGPGASSEANHPDRRRRRRVA
jgi:hypothetical protein